jgi:hypothetical protein
MLDLLERRETEALLALVAQHNRQAQAAYEELLRQQAHF